MDEFDLDVRNTTYAAFVELGRAPTPPEVAGRMGTPTSDVHASWQRLHDQHAIVLRPDRASLLMCNPFSAVPTPHTVHAAGRSWAANCAWDAFGICAALHSNGRIETSCPDCDAAIELDVVDGAPSERSLLFHSLVTATHWWDDIAFT